MLELEWITGKELKEEYEVKLASKTWGNWKLLDKYYLVYNQLDYTLPGVGFYEVDLQTCTTSAELLDWIIQVSGKGFIYENPQNMVDFLEALAMLIQPQKNLCSWGKDQGKIDINKILGYK